MREDQQRSSLGEALVIVSVAGSSAIVAVAFSFLPIALYGRWLTTATMHEILVCSGLVACTFGFVALSLRFLPDQLNPSGMRAIFVIFFLVHDLLVSYHNWQGSDGPTLWGAPLSSFLVLGHTAGFELVSHPGLFLFDVAFLVGVATLLSCTGWLRAITFATLSGQQRLWRLGLLVLFAVPLFAISSLMYVLLPTLALVAWAMTPRNDSDRTWLCAARGVLVAVVLSVAWWGLSECIQPLLGANVRFISKTSIHGAMFSYPLNVIKNDPHTFLLTMADLLDVLSWPFLLYRPRSQRHPVGFTLGLAMVAMTAALGVLFTVTSQKWALTERDESFFGYPTRVASPPPQEKSCLCPDFRTAGRAGLSDNVDSMKSALNDLPKSNAQTDTDRITSAMGAAIYERSIYHDDSRNSATFSFRGVNLIDVFAYSPLHIPSSHELSFALTTDHHPLGAPVDAFVQCLGADLNLNSYMVFRLLGSGAAVLLVTPEPDRIRVWAEGCWIGDEESVIGKRMVELDYKTNAVTVQAYQESRQSMWIFGPWLTRMKISSVPMPE